MNRRQFTQSIAALVATPALPSGVLAKVATTAKPLHMYQHPYCWAAFIARVHDNASPAMFKRHLGLSDDKAKHVFDTLLNEQVLAKPNALGISKTLAPYKRSAGQMIRYQSASTGTSNATPAQSNPDLKKIDTQKLMQTDDEIGDDSISVNQEVTQSVDDIEQSTSISDTDTQNDTRSDQLD